MLQHHFANDAQIMAVPFQLTGDGYESQWQGAYTNGQKGDLNHVVVTWSFTRLEMPLLCV